MTLLEHQMTISPHPISFRLFAHPQAAFDGNKRTHRKRFFHVFWGDRTNGLNDDLKQHIDQQLADIIQQSNASNDL
jgi:hypothetical protein